MLTTQRAVQKNTLRSGHLPAIEIQFHPEFSYAGRTTFILYDVAGIEKSHPAAKLDGFLISTTRSVQAGGGLCICWRANRR